MAQKIYPSEFVVIGVIDYGIGNPKSIVRMCEVNGIGAKIVKDSSSLDDITRLVLPGVGHFDSCVTAFRNFEAEQYVLSLVSQDGIPMMGICVGAQMLGFESEEGIHQGLKLMPHSTKRIKTSFSPVPHIGWETIETKSHSPLRESLSPDARFYFTHSYVIEAFQNENVCATFEYETTYHAATYHENMVAFQFHPEKSHRYGAEIFHWFSNWIP